MSSRPSSPKTKLKEILKMKKKVLRLTQGALIAAIYVCLSVAPVVSSFAYGQIQFRIAEALMLLCLFSPSAVFGVTIGCFLANLFSPFGVNVFDIIFGTSATLIAAFATYFLRNFFTKSKTTLFLSPLMTILSNAFIVGTYLPLITMGSFSIAAASFCWLTVGAGEAAVLYIIGIPLYLFSKTKKLIK